MAKLTKADMAIYATKKFRYELTNEERLSQIDCRIHHVRELPATIDTANMLLFYTENKTQLVLHCNRKLFLAKIQEPVHTKLLILLFKKYPTVENLHIFR